jgi:adenylate kinase family enzyme
MKKITIIGAPGTGKSTLARTLHRITQIPVIHLDVFFWRPGWQETPKEAWIALQQEMIQGEAWIIDGTYQSTIDIRLRAADVIIFLDIPRFLYLWRVIKRHILYQRRSRLDLAKGCSEKITWSYLQDIWHFPLKERNILLEKLSALGNEKQIVWLTSTQEVSNFEKILQMTPNIKNDDVLDHYLSIDFSAKKGNIA